jgi:hypothetical protein
VGSQQVITLTVYLVVLDRYRNLILRMFLLMRVAVGFRSVAASMHRLSEDFYVRTTPSKFGALIAGLLGLVLLCWARRNLSRS